MTLRSRFSAIPARVAQVHVDGLARTHPGVVTAALGPLFKTRDYGQVVTATKEVQAELKYEKKYIPYYLHHNFNMDFLMLST